MSQENFEIVHKVFDAFSRGDTEGVLGLCDENIVITHLDQVLDARSLAARQSAPLLIGLRPDRLDLGRLSLA